MDTRELYYCAVWSEMTPFITSINVYYNIMNIPVFILPNTARYKT